MGTYNVISNVQRQSLSPSQWCSDLSLLVPAPEKIRTPMEDFLVQTPPPCWKQMSVQLYTVFAFEAPLPLEFPMTFRGGYGYLLKLHFITTFEIS